MLDHNKPFVSVVIPTNNRPCELAKCMHALSKQKEEFGEFEVILINDGGINVDKTSREFLELAKRVTHNRLTCINLTENYGSAYARNLGFSISQGEIVCFTDDDAIPATDWLFKICEFFNKSPQVHAMNGRIEAVATHTSVEKVRQAYYDFRQYYHKNGYADKQIRNSFKIQNNAKCLTDWLSLGNCAIRKPQKVICPLFDNTMQLNYGHLLGRSLLSQGLIVCYDDAPVVTHHHGRKLSDFLATKFKNGRYHSLIDSVGAGSIKHRLYELTAMTAYCLHNESMRLKDWYVLLLGSLCYITGYVCRKLYMSDRTIVCNKQKYFLVPSN